jgi:hypothetical protein
LLEGCKGIKKKESEKQYYGRGIRSKKTNPARKDLAGFVLIIPMRM